MNLDETHQIENVENNCVAGTLVLNETKSIEKLKEAVITPSKEENKNNLVVEASPKLFELGSIKSVKILLNLIIFIYVLTNFIFNFLAICQQNRQQLC